MFSILNKLVSIVVLHVKVFKRKLIDVIISWFEWRVYEDLGVTFLTIF